ncbi:lantibiotic dehydratase C-terminal domain-containing protein [Chitinophaga sp. 30R24]|uniref:lantibiotic dehydratase C-terminal domain-containing protein n=1 Tax=Chitinophaga sp. 30R24 TaxID=3248838 RepID=UPI003B8F19E3
MFAPPVINWNREAVLFASYIHMFVNQMFMNHQRYKEMTIYYFMDRFYASEIARNKKISTPDLKW